MYIKEDPGVVGVNTGGEKDDKDTTEHQQNKGHNSPTPPPTELAHRTRRLPVDAAVSKRPKRILIVFLALAIFATTILKPSVKVYCKLPVLPGYFPHCAEEPTVTPDFITLAQLQSRLEQVMVDSTRGSLAAVDIKNSEMALRDLGTLVRHSSLSSKDMLGRDLQAFVQDASTTGRGLQQFGSRVWGAVDRIVSLNEHTLIMLEGTSAGQGGKPQRKGVEDIWLQSIDLLDKTLRKLIHEAHANIGSLQRLEEKLHNIEDMVVVEKQGIQAAEGALKQQWFTELLGMNEESHRSNFASLELLETVKSNRKYALDHVTEVLDSLNKMSYDLDNLREGVATPIIIAGSSNIPIESHINSIRSGTERLVNGQARMREIEDDYRQRKFSG